MPDEIDPYRISAGPILDALVHTHLFGPKLPGCVPPYSADEELARAVEDELRSQVKSRVVVGRSRVKAKPWFARYGTDPSTSSEVLAQSYPLAICRLTLLVLRHDENRRET